MARAERTVGARKKEIALQLAPASALLNSPPKPAAYIVLCGSIVRTLIQHPIPNCKFVGIQLFPPSLLLRTRFCRFGTRTLAYKVFGLRGSITMEKTIVPVNAAEVASLQDSPRSPLRKTRLSHCGGGSLPL